MNVVILQGRLTDDPKIYYGKDNSVSVARYTLAVDRYFKKEGENDTDFIRCVAFTKGAEFAGKYLSKGMKITIRGHIQTGSYNDRNGVKVYTTDVIVDEHAFCESKKSYTDSYNKGPATYQNQGQGYQNQTYQTATQNTPNNRGTVYPSRNPNGYPPYASVQGKTSDAGYSASTGVSHVSNTNTAYTKDPSFADGFMNIPDGIDEELPFN